MKEEYLRDERHLERSSYPDSHCNSWKKQHSARAMMLPREWLEDAQRMGVQQGPTLWSISCDSTCRRRKVRPPSVEELENRELMWEWGHWLDKILLIQVCQEGKYKRRHLRHESNIPDDGRAKPCRNFNNCASVKNVLQWKSMQNFMEADSAIWKDK